MKLKLLMNAKVVVESAVLAGRFPESINDQVYEYLGAGESPDYDSIEKLFAEAVNKATSGEIKISEFDPNLAVELHKLLPLSRHEASRIEFWHHLAIDVCRGYTNNRWPKKKERFSEEFTYPEERYHGRWTRNAVARLWWWAELTRQTGEDPYRYTMQISDQRFMLRIKDQLAAGNSFLTSALCREFIENKTWIEETAGVGSNDFIDKVWDHINIRLGTIVLSVLAEQEVSELVDECVRAAKAELTGQ